MADETTATETPEQTLTREYAEVKTEMTLSVNRRDALQAKGKSLDGLSDNEELELLRLERRVTNLTPVLEDLQRKMYLKDAAIDLEAILADWHGLLEEKRKAYLNFFNAIARLKNAHGILLGVHRLQEQVVQRLPGEVVQRLSFPSVGQFEMNLISRMPNSMGWRTVFGPPEPCALPKPDQVEDVDPGVRELSPRVIKRLQEDYRLWKEAR